MFTKICVAFASSISVVLCGFYIYITYIYHVNSWEIAKDYSTAINYLFSDHPLFFLYCKTLSYISIYLAAFYAFNITRLKNDNAKRKYTRIAATSAAASGFLSLDLTSQYNKALPYSLETADKLPHSYVFLHSVCNVVDVIGRFLGIILFLVSVICFFSKGPIYRQLLGKERGRRPKPRHPFSPYKPRSNTEPDPSPSPISCAK